MQLLSPVTLYKEYINIVEQKGEQIVELDNTTDVQEVLDQEQLVTDNIVNLELATRWVGRLLGAAERTQTGLRRRWARRLIRLLQRVRSAFGVRLRPHRGGPAKRSEAEAARPRPWAT